MSQRITNYDLNKSINQFLTQSKSNELDLQRDRVLNVIEKFLSGSTELSRFSFNEYKKNVLKKAYDCMKSGASPDGANFDIDAYSLDELKLLQENELPEYIFHRYRYIVYPIKHLLDNYPPCVQVELTSLCNFRCTFCYQSDPTFTARKNGQMGSMDIDLFKEVIDQLEGNVQFLTFASRGEPLLAKDFTRMLDYSKGKFLSLKLNTNASLLNEEKIHAILNSGISTLVFSADAANEKDYARFRVNGSFEKTIKNIEKFQEIRNKEYSHIKLNTRVSGVWVDPASQDIYEMNKVWGQYVDQVSFVNYSPWEKIYSAPENDITTPCSDLWRRMFIWFDGGVAPCDNDYKSLLKVGSIQDNSLSKFWGDGKYTQLRLDHKNQNRKLHEPCKRCIVY